MASNINGNAHFTSLGGAQVDLDYGTIPFVTTGLNVETPTSMGVIQAGFAMPESYTGGAATGGHVTTVDRALATEPYTTTISRKKSVDSAGVFQYLFMGNKQGTSDQARYAKLQVRGYGEIELQWGSTTFNDTDVTVEVSTLLSNVHCAIATLDAHTDVAGAGENVLFCDRTVTTRAVTVERKVEGGNDDGFSYLFVGGNQSAWPATSTIGFSVVVELDSYGNEPTYIQFGNDNFVTTGTTLEVPTPLANVQCVIALPEAYGASAGAGENVMFSDRTVSSGAVTLARKVGTGSADGFSYIMIGQK